MWKLKVAVHAPLRLVHGLQVDLCENFWGTSILISCAYSICTSKTEWVLPCVYSQRSHGGGHPWEISKRCMYLVLCGTVPGRGSYALLMHSIADIFNSASFSAHMHACTKEFTHISVFGAYNSSRGQYTVVGIGSFCLFGPKIQTHFASLGGRHLCKQNT